MYKRSGQLVFSPSDINRFFDSRFGSWMDRFHVERPGAVTRDAPDPQLKLLAAMGIAHEQRYLESLRASGRDVWEPARSDKKPPFDEQLEATLGAMRAGHDVIYQAALRHGEFEGYADFLLRVPRPSQLGDFSYEVADTKLARHPKPYFLLQLCAYAKMLEHLQGVRPANVYIVDGAAQQLTFRTDDYYFYFTSLEEEFLHYQRAFHPEQRPVPDARADHGHWRTYADEILEATDHPCRVAGITSHQMKRLAEAGITTRAQLATDTRVHIPNVDDSVFARLRAQARLQVASHGRHTPSYELIAQEDDTQRVGLALLPPVSPKDVYFDMEGYPLVEGGLEYLFGVTHMERGKPAFKDFWAHDRASEKRAFEGFIDWVYERYRSDRSMHVFHYASYERSALCRLMGTHGTRERELDALLRGEVFVDLYRVVKQSVRIGQPSYSLKKVEHLYRPARHGDVANAAQSVVEYARWIEAKDGADWETSSILRGIRDYNRDDCESTWELRMWLAARQAEASIAYIPPGKHEQGAEPEREPARDENQALSRRLIDSIPADRSADPERWRIQELLGHLVEFHRRERKPLWWAVFERQGKTHEELVEDSDCLGACQRTATPPIEGKKSCDYEYSFDPDQDTQLREGDRCFIAEDLVRTSIVKLDAAVGLVLIKLGKGSSQPPDLISLIPDEEVRTDTLEASIASIAKSWEATGKLAPALDTLLRRSMPRVKGVQPGAELLAARDATADAVSDVMLNLDQTSISIQGPPGTGKTRVASAAISALAMRGCRIGISSNSHKAIQKLIQEVQKRALAHGVPLRITKINSDPSKDELIASGKVTGAKSIKDVELEGADSPQVVGGTAWAFSAPHAVGQFDYLFIDEAGQVSLANLVAMSPAAKNLVLLGDQMQLGQPIQGSHPGESGQSALEYLLQGSRTVPANLGIFLGTTWRLHPRICDFISGAAYEDKLHAHASTATRVIHLPRSAAGRLLDREAGILYVPVEHEGNAQASDEEVDTIAALLAELRECERVGDASERPRKLANEDVLVVAPYNKQVRALQAKIAGVMSGSVDKFQGQEAAVVIVSMCASSGEGTPRGVEFLLNLNRLNVALSRAQSLAIVVGSPRLGRMRVRSVAQMKLVNLFCRIVREG
jgi:predicted RecB family nuclease